MVVIKCGGVVRVLIDSPYCSVSASYRKYHTSVAGIEACVSKSDNWLKSCPIIRKCIVHTGDRLSDQSLGSPTEGY